MFNKYYEDLLNEIKMYNSILGKKMEIREFIENNEIELEYSGNRIICIKICPNYLNERYNQIEWRLYVEYTMKGRNEMIDKFSDNIEDISENIDYSYYLYGYKIIHHNKIMHEINRLYTWNL